MSFYLLFESAAGYALFEGSNIEEIGNLYSKVQKSLLDFGKFSKIVQLKAFRPFTSPEIALENVNDVSEGILNDFLSEFLEQNLSKKDILGVSDQSYAQAVKEQLGIDCKKDASVMEIIRAIRHHFDKFITKAVKSKDTKFMFKSQRGLAHSYSRAKVKFNVHRADNMIMQTISTLDQLDKDINTFAMRVREWYSWHFPELVKIVNDNHLYACLAAHIGNRESIDDSTVDAIEKIIGDRPKAELIVSAARSSMGYDISDFDIKLVDRFAQKVVDLGNFRKNLSAYLSEKMEQVAPNLRALIGEVVGARLIHHAGSLIALAKYPASTVQILGAEKALFRALKTNTNTPKYGLIFNSSYIGRARTRDKGKISRYLSNKCSIASRIDAFSDSTGNDWGVALAKQVEDRLAFYEKGIAPPKNIDVMKEVAGKISTNGKAKAKVSDMEVEESKVTETKKEKKRRRSSTETDGKSKKKKRKSKGGK